MPGKGQDPYEGSGQSRLAAEIDYRASPAVKDALAMLGRTEDVRFSPNNSLLALAGYTKRTCLVLAMRIAAGDGGMEVFLDDFLEITSPEIADPHGFDFIGNDRLVVANRAGLITIFHVPKPPFNGRSLALTPEKTLRKVGLFNRLKKPGSVAVIRRSERMAEIFACNTYHNRVSAHKVGGGLLGKLGGNRVVAEKGLDVPDGIAISPDKRFMAISNHDHHCVSIFDLTRKTGRDARIAGTLRGFDYPHGLRFSPDGRSLYVADAGAPFVRKFETPDGNWAVEAEPVKSVEVLSQQVFLAGRHNEQEGGPKGLDLDRSASIMAITCEEQPLAFFDLKKLFG